MHDDLPLVIIGCGGFGREVLDVIDGSDPSPPHSFAGFLDDVEPAPELLAGLGAIWLGTLERILDLDAAYVIGIADPDTRSRIDRSLATAGRAIATLVHATATIGRDSSLAPGAILAAGARISTHVRAGRHLQVNPNATVGHDCTLGDFVTVYPGAAVGGNVTLADRVTVGAGASILQGLTIGVGAFVGAGAVVVRDVGAGETVAGVPARTLRR